MKSIVGWITVILVLSTCGKKPNAETWPTEKVSAAKDRCTVETLRRRTTPEITHDNLQRYCGCFMDELTGRYSYDEFRRKGSEVETEMLADGTVARCLKKAGIDGTKLKDSKKGEERGESEREKEK